MIQIFLQRHVESLLQGQRSLVARVSVVDSSAPWGLLLPLLGRPGHIVSAVSFLVAFCGACLPQLLRFPWVLFLGELVRPLRVVEIDCERVKRFLR